MSTSDLSTTKATVLAGYRFNLAYMQQLVADVPEHQMWHSPGAGLENHPAFALGHLVMAAARVVRMLGGEWDTPEGWRELFDRKGPGDPRVAEAAPIYPSKATLLAEYERQHSRVEEAIHTATTEFWNERMEWRLADRFPTRGQAASFMCLHHEAMHLSDLASWRRALGYPSAFALL